MRDCPKCGASVDGAWCNQCGEGRNASAHRDPLRYLCHHETRGLRCANLGAMSPNTIGDPKGGAHPGPWYCWQHARHVHGGDGGARSSPQDAAEGLAKARAAVRPRTVDFEAIAERIAMQTEPT